MISRFENSPHFHVHWIHPEKLDWECFETYDEAARSAIQLARQGEQFRIVEVFSACPLLDRRNGRKAPDSAIEPGQH
jgi:hypothetical protein